MIHDAIVGIQARLGSSRLPGKVLMDLCGKPLLERVWDACEGPWDRFLLIPNSTHDDDLAMWAYRKHLPVMRGPEHNVLARYMMLVETFRPGRLVRVCGDAPFIRSEWIKAAIDQPEPVFVHSALHCGSWKTWRTCAKELQSDEHAGHDWFQERGMLMDLVPSDYLMVNTQEDLDEARRRWGCQT